MSLTSNNQLFKHSRGIGLARHLSAVVLITGALVGLPQAAKAENPVVKIATGQDHMCALMVNGTVECVGNNSTGELGNNSTISSTTPVLVYGITNAIDISAGTDFSCAVLATGRVTCWGQNNWAQLGVGLAGGGYKTIPEPMYSIENARSITSERSFSCAVTTANTSYCWGIDITRSVLAASASSNAVSLTTSSGMNSSQWANTRCSNDVWCQGIWNVTGGANFGVADFDYFGLITVPKAQATTLGQVSSIYIGGNAGHTKVATSYGQGGVNLGTENSTCVIKTDASLTCFGIFTVGSGLADVSSVALGNNHACAVIKDGTIKCWGNNSLGQFGNAGASAPGVSVYQVQGINNATKVFADGDHTCAILSDGKVFCWGVGTSGELGQGSTASSNIPVQALGVLDPVSMSMGPQSSCATFADNSSKCWGLNTSGQLNIGSTSSVSTPTSVNTFLMFQTSTPTPSISGQPTVGKILTAIPGTWDDGVNLSYQWNRDGVPISGATGIGYTVLAADATRQITVTVTSDKSGYASESRTSLPTTAVETAITFTPTPVISGSVQVASTLSANVGTWDEGVVTSLQWLRNGLPISGATSNTLLLSTGDLGTKISIQVTGSKSGATTVVKTSAQTANVDSGSIILNPKPTITGNLNVGQTLSATIGSWDSGTSLSYQWYRGANLISGATSTTYQLTADDLGSTIAFATTGSKPGYTSVTKKSDSSVAVSAGTIGSSPTPVIQGTVAVGQTLTASLGSWSIGTATSIKWLKNGQEISGQTGSSYVVSQGDLGSNLSVQVTGYILGYAAVTKTSIASQAVSAGTLVSSQAPTISGSPIVGNTLTASTGTWDSGVAFSYRWLRDGNEISGQTASTYVIQPADRGSSISVEVTGTKLGYNGILLTSASTNLVTYGQLSSAPTPVISGSVVVGGTLVVSAGSWDDGVSLSYQWLRGGVAISGATSSSYVLLPSDLGAVFTVTVTGSKSGYVTVVKTSAATAATSAGAFSLAPVPSISGSAVVAGTLTANSGVWDSGVSLSYQWLRGGVAVSGATSSSYVLLPSDLGGVFTVTVTGSKVGYSTTSKTSAATSAVSAGSFVSTPVPTISGVPSVGQVLTVSTGTWDDGASFSYQWLRGGVAVSGATSTTYTVLSSDRGLVFSVSVTATRTGYSSVTLVSPSTSAVDYGVQVSSASPVVSVVGSAGIVVGSTLNVAPGIWDSGVAISYQWLRSGSAVSGQTGSSYVLTSDDFGADITVSVTGTKAGFVSVVKVAAAASPVGFGSLSLTPTPTLSGLAKVGSTLTAVTGTWDSGVSLAYRWFRDGFEILGQTGATYVITSSDFGKPITVTVSAFKAGYTSVSKSSSATAQVNSGAMSLTPLPVINGVSSVGSTLTVTAGTWDSGVSLSYQWLRNGSEIAGANSTTYFLTVDDRNYSISVRVTGTKTNYVDVSKTSSLTQIVDNGQLSSAPTPVISGSVVVGQPLNVTLGLWPDGVAVRIQWFRYGTAIQGANSLKYTLTAEDAGAQIFVEATGTKDGYMPLRMQSELTGEVQDGQFASAPTPSITGVPKMGYTLTAALGNWDYGVEFQYQWLRGGDAIDGAIDPTYSIVSEDVGEIIGVQVTANLDGYTPIVYVVSTSKPIVPGVLTLAKPTITGTQQVGALLTLQHLDPTPIGADQFVQWYRGPTAIVDATSWTYTLVAADRGQVVSAKITATLDGYLDTTVTSSKTAPIAFGALSVRGSVALSALSAKVGATLTANPADWDPGAAIKYQWRRNGVAISGATAKTYKLIAADKGKKITVTVVVSKTGYTSVTITSAATSLIG